MTFGTPIAGLHTHKPLRNRTADPGLLHGAHLEDRFHISAGAVRPADGKQVGRQSFVSRLMEGLRRD